MNAGNRRFLAVVVVLGTALLCGCAAPRSEVKKAGTALSEEEKPVVRLPYGTPLKIEQTPPPTAETITASPQEVQDGRAHSLKLFQVDFGQKKAGPPAVEGPASPTAPSEAEPEP